MATIPIHPPTRDPHSQPLQNALPQLLHTPSGLALLELQGTINLPSQPQIDLSSSMDVDGQAQETSIGRLVFPDYHPALQDPSSTAWMKRVYLYVGKHQRLTGEVKKLPKAIAIIRKRHTDTDTATDELAEELEVVEIVKFKILFSHRPEPVGSDN